MYFSLIDFIEDEVEQHYAQKINHEQAEKILERLLEDGSLTECVASCLDDVSEELGWELQDFKTTDPFDSSGAVPPMAPPPIMKDSNKKSKEQINMQFPYSVNMLDHIRRVTEQVYEEKISDETAEKIFSSMMDNLSLDTAIKAAIAIRIESEDWDWRCKVCQCSESCWGEGDEDVDTDIDVNDIPLI